MILEKCSGSGLTGVSGDKVRLDKPLRVPPATVSTPPFTGRFSGRCNFSKYCVAVGKPTIQPNSPL